MDKNQIRKDIESLISNIKEHFDNALDHDHIPTLELETIVNKIEKLHQKAIIFHYLNDKEQSAEKNNSNPEKSSVQTDLFGAPINPKTIPQPTIKSEPAIERKSEPVTDIRSAIGINDKFQFINELFEGNLNEYNAAIDQLNNYASFAEAEIYLNSIKDIYKWKDEDVTAEKFIGIAKRRFK